MSRADFKDLVETCDETLLYLTINQLGGILWCVRHDLADERISSNPELEQWLVHAQEMIEYAVDQTARFGLQPRGEGRGASSEYWTWYREQDAWWKELEEVEQEAILAKYDAAPKKQQE